MTTLPALAVHGENDGTTEIALCPLHDLTAHKRCRFTSFQDGIKISRSRRCLRSSERLNEGERSSSAGSTQDPRFSLSPR